MLLLGVNIDHIATLRQARYRGSLDLPNAEPSIFAAAQICEKAGADSITVHLRADRRHIQDRDVTEIRKSIGLRLNLEMGNTPEIVEFALATRPDDVCMVPENREEITTEGGLDVAGLSASLAPTIQRLQAVGTRVSLFIDPEPKQVEASVKLGATMVELHTGAFANAFGASREIELGRLIESAELAHNAGLQVNAGHGINYDNIYEILSIPNLTELNIGHSIISRAVFTGLEQAIRDLLAIMKR